MSRLIPLGRLTMRRRARATPVLDCSLLPIPQSSFAWPNHHDRDLTRSLSPDPAQVPTRAWLSVPLDPCTDRLEVCLSDALPGCAVPQPHRLPHETQLYCLPSLCGYCPTSFQVA
ncbi:hypothetical protein VTN00DRAFT_1588 [Thermoascus crustaceus]|uniref:uncharacterized protein n=1 Tax=Thermoascus crustaceus TaxID=5088 RepID=UPI0037442650